MKSGLEDRNNLKVFQHSKRDKMVSMKSGLEDRNNDILALDREFDCLCLNEVRPGRPEQSTTFPSSCRIRAICVSMKSGLEDRNNPPCSAGLPVPYGSQ